MPFTRSDKVCIGSSPRPTTQPIDAKLIDLLDDLDAEERERRLSTQNEIAALETADLITNISMQAVNSMREAHAQEVADLKNTIKKNEIDIAEMKRALSAITDALPLEKPKLTRQVGFYKQHVADTMKTRQKNKIRPIWH